MQKILERQHASRVPENELTQTPGKVWYLPHFDEYHPKKPDQVRVVFDRSALYNSQSLNKNLLQGPDQLNSLISRDSARRRNDTLKKASSLYKLDPFVDKNGLLRTGGRIRPADVLLEVKQPLILPKKSRISDLIVRYFHESVGHHQGRGVTHNTIRQAGYWIVDGRSTVARTISKCVTCR